MQNYSKLNEFLKELSELSAEYGIFIDGCGCCGSPYLENTEGYRIGINLEYNKLTTQYEISE